MKLLKSLACVLLTSAAMLSASGFDSTTGDVDGSEISRSFTESHAKAIGTDTFPITSNEVASVVLLTLSEQANEAGNEEISSVFTSLLGQDSATIISGLKGISFTMSVEGTEENLTTDVPEINAITFLRDTTAELVTFLETFDVAPTTWYTSASSLVPTSEATESATVWGISQAQREVFNLARLTTGIRYSNSSDMESSMTEQTILVSSLFSYDPREALDILENGRLDIKLSSDSSVNAEEIAAAERAKVKLMDALTSVIQSLTADETSSAVVTEGRGRLNSSEDHSDIADLLKTMTVQQITATVKEGTES